MGLPNYAGVYAAATTTSVADFCAGDRRQRALSAGACFELGLIEVTAVSVGLCARAATTSSEDDYVGQNV